MHGDDVLLHCLRVVSMLAPSAIGHHVVYARATYVCLFHASADFVLSIRLNCTLKPTRISGAYQKCCDSSFTEWLVSK